MADRVLKRDGWPGARPGTRNCDQTSGSFGGGSNRGSHERRFWPSVRAVFRHILFFIHRCAMT